MFAPKAARGMAKHTLVRATTLWRPRAWATSVLAANRPITSTARPAAEIQKAVLTLLPILPYRRARVEDQLAQRRCGHRRSALRPGDDRAGRLRAPRTSSRAIAAAKRSSRGASVGDVEANPRRDRSPDAAHVVRPQGRHFYPSSRASRTRVLRRRRPDRRRHAVLSGSVEGAAP